MAGGFCDPISERTQCWGAMCELTSIADGRLRTTNATLAHANADRQVRNLLKRAYEEHSGAVASLRNKTARGNSCAGGRTPAQIHVQGVCFRLIEPIPAATFSPLLPETLSGCSENDLSNPPTSTFAPTPTPAVAPALTPT
jgi:hypothetical protein